MRAVAAAAAALALGACGQEEPPRVEATEFRFEPAAVTLELGEIEVVNAGEVPHALAIQGPDDELATDTVEPGESAGLSVELPPGRYEMYCPVGDHRERGMEGTITVEEGGGESQEDSGGGGGGLGY